jgi:hypothetical protein
MATGLIAERRLIGSVQIDESQIAECQLRNADF